MEITQQIIADVLSSKTCNNFEIKNNHQAQATQTKQKKTQTVQTPPCTTHPSTIPHTQIIQITAKPIPRPRPPYKIKTRYTQIAINKTCKMKT